MTLLALVNRGGPTSLSGLPFYKATAKYQIQEVNNVQYRWFASHVLLFIAPVNARIHGIFGLNYNLKWGFFSPKVQFRALKPQSWRHESSSGSRVCSEPVFCFSFWCWSWNHDFNEQSCRRARDAISVLDEIAASHLSLHPQRHYPSLSFFLSPKNSWVSFKACAIVFFFRNAVMSYLPIFHRLVKTSVNMQFVTNPPSSQFL